MVQICFCALSLGPCCACSLEGTFPLQAGFATCLWNIFFSYLRDKWDLHFPLNTNWLCLFFFFFPNKWHLSNVPVFLSVTFSNNWAAGAGWASVHHQWKGKSPHFYSVAREQEGMKQLLESLSHRDCFWRRPRNFFYGGFWVDSLKRLIFLSG